MGLMNMLFQSVRASSIHLRDLVGSGLGRLLDPPLQTILSQDFLS